MTLILVANTACGVDWHLSHVISILMITRITLGARVHCITVTDSELYTLVTFHLNLRGGLSQHSEIHQL